jgi:hypothetical protein
MDRQIDLTLRSLHLRNLGGIFAESRDEAKREILDLIPKHAVVGVGDSTTVRQVGVKEELKRRGTTVLDGFDNSIVYTNIKDWEYREDLVKKSTTCDVFLTGTNVITEDGKLVNVDAVGNRVAGMFWGHPTVIIIVGRNKIVKNLDEAFHRLRKVTAPNHIGMRVQLGGRRVETPCATTCECSDCHTNDRMCNIFTIIEGRPRRTDIKVVIVNEDLGLGWDESWPQERVSKIIENYRRFVWLPPADLSSR